MIVFAVAGPAAVGADDGRAGADEAVQATVYRTALLADAGQDVVNERIAAKGLAAEVANQRVDLAVQLAVQLVGSEALVLGHPLKHMLRRVRALRLAECEGETDPRRRFGALWPIRSFEDVVTPPRQPAHDWPICGPDVNRGQGAADSGWSELPDGARR